VGDLQLQLACPLPTGAAMAQGSRRTGGFSCRFQRYVRLGEVRPMPLPEQIGECNWFVVGAVQEEIEDLSTRLLGSATRAAESILLKLYSTGPASRVQGLAQHDSGSGGIGPSLASTIKQGPSPCEDPLPSREVRVGPGGVNILMAYRP